jgi:surface protein
MPAGANAAGGGAPELDLPTKAMPPGMWRTLLLPRLNLGWCAIAFALLLAAPAASSAVESGSGADFDADAELQGKVEAWLFDKQEALAKFGPIGAWDTSDVRSMRNLFRSAVSFDEDINGWDVSGTHDLHATFEGATAFTGKLSGWDVSAAVDVGYMFSGASKFASDLSLWDVSKARNMVWMFSASEFTSDLSGWDVSAATDTGWMFFNAPKFTSDLSSWDVTSVQNARAMFGRRLFVGETSVFTSDLSGWDVSGFRDLSHAFQGAAKFTSDLSGWDVHGVRDMTNMFTQATEFTSNFSSWQVMHDTGVANMFEGTRVLDDYAGNLPCWYTGATCPLVLTFVGERGTRKPLSESLGVTTVNPSEMSATNAYRVGTTYRIAPLSIEGDSNLTYSLLDATDDMYINPNTGVVLATFGSHDVTGGSSADSTRGNEPLKVTLQVIANTGDLRAELETYTVHVKDRETFALVLGGLKIDDVYHDQYLESSNETATIVEVDKPFRIAARQVDRSETVLSEGAFDDITYSFKVLDTATGDPIATELARVSMKPHGEILGEFSAAEVGTLTVIVTVADGGGATFRLDPILLDVRVLDVDVPGYGPNGKGCANSGVPVDDSGDLFDGKFTSCDCRALLYVGDNCDELCPRGQSKQSETDECVHESLNTTTSTKLASTALAAVAGALVVIVLLAAAARRHHKYKKSLRPIDFVELNRQMYEDGFIMGDQLHADRKPRELRRSSVVLLEQIGSGSFGAVWKAMLDESSSTGTPEYQVAAKTVLEGAPPEARTELATEAAMMAQLAGHKNLVSIIGVVSSGSPLIVLLSYCDRGSMLSHLTERAAAGKPVVTEHKLDFAAQTASGMEHLCARHFVHRDLAARNVLLTSGQSASGVACKVADFGLSRIGSRGKKDGSNDGDNYYRSKKGTFPLRWTAPEAMDSLVFNQASDVWSFGILLIEIVQDGGRPYNDLKQNSDVVALTLAGRRHPQPLGCSNGLYTIMMRCWDVEPKERPSFTDLALELRQMCTRAGIWGDDVAGGADDHDGENSDLVNRSLGLKSAPHARDARRFPHRYSSPAVAVSSMASSDSGAGGDSSGHIGDGVDRLVDPPASTRHSGSKAAVGNHFEYEPLVRDGTADHLRVQSLYSESNIGGAVGITMAGGGVGAEYEPLVRDEAGVTHPIQPLYSSGSFFTADAPRQRQTVAAVAESSDQAEQAPRSRTSVFV